MGTALILIGALVLLCGYGNIKRGRGGKVTREGCVIAIVGIALIAIGSSIRSLFPESPPAGQPSIQRDPVVPQNTPREHPESDAKSGDQTEAFSLMVELSQQFESGLSWDVLTERLRKLVRDFPKAKAVQSASQLIDQIEKLESECGSAVSEAKRQFAQHKYGRVVELVRPILAHKGSASFKEASALTSQVDSIETEAKNELIELRTFTSTHDLAQAKERIEAFVERHPSTTAAVNATLLLTELKEREEAARNKLVLAKSLFKKERSPAARRRLEEIVKDYGNTEAAKEAATLLKLF